MSTAVTADTAPVRVGVVDSGWDWSIADARLETGVGLVSSAEGLPVLEWSANTQDQVGHGTGCSDVILQVAPEARIVPIRVFGETLETSPAILVEAIRWAVLHDLRLVNLSLGTVRSDTLGILYSVCEWARQRGTTIVAAAGARAEDTFPAIFEPVIGVASATTDERFAISFHADRALDCEARGVHFARGLGGVERMFVGSSFAAPVVTGHIARFLAARPRCTLADVRDRLAELSQQYSGGSAPHA
ncbi:MAG: S8 family serine peptidase [Pseudomonadota bacterium]|jgi:subtilisin family serine protease